MSRRLFERSADPFETVNHKNQHKLLQENEMLNKSQETKRWTVDVYIYRCPLILWFTCLALIIFLFTTFLFYLIIFESIHIFGRFYCLICRNLFYLTTLYGYVNSNIMIYFIEIYIN